MATEYKYIPIVYKNGSSNMNISAIHNAAPGRTYDIGADYVDSSEYTGISVPYKNKAVVKPQKKSFVVQKGVISTILVIIAVFFMLALVLNGNAKISSVTIENSRIANEITNLENDINDLELEISLATDIDYIQERASELGMGVPSSDQIVYVQPQ